MFGCPSSRPSVGRTWNRNEHPLGVRARPGDAPLTADAAVMIGDAADVAEARRAAREGERPRRRPARFVNRQVPHDLTPVTDALLADPPPGDWLSWRRTRNSHGYSPLDQVTRDNVDQLQLAWVLAIREGRHQTTPLVHEGVMFLANPGSVVQAIDATTGDVIWQYRSPLPEDAPQRAPTRTLALYGDKVFLATADAALVALDARTGEEAWRTMKADYAQGFRQNAGPVIADGVVVTGTNGCQRYKEQTCFITGHDPDTGEELWRTSTIALPGDPNDASWGDTPPYLRAGGDAWIPGSYDPDLGLFYIGTAQAKPWVAASRGMTTRQDALYTNSTLALNPRTGQVQWYFQHAPGETLDLDIVYERVLVDADDEQWLFTIGKDGILWKLDRRTGALVDLRETVYQDIFESIDRTTGRFSYRQDIRDAGIGDRVPACPSLLGGHNWQGLGISPRRRGARDSAPPGVHVPDRPRGGVRRGRRRRGGPVRVPRDAGHRRERGQAGRLRRADDGRAVEPRAARRVPDGDVDDGGRTRVRRRCRPLLPGVRHSDGGRPVGDSPRRRGGGLSDHLRSGRTAVHRRPGRAGGRVPEPHRAAHPGDLPAGGGERALRLRPAGNIWCAGVSVHLPSAPALRVKGTQAAVPVSGRRCEGRAESAPVVVGRMPSSLENRSSAVEDSISGTVRAARRIGVRSGRMVSNRLNLPARSKTHRRQPELLVYPCFSWVGAADDSARSGAASIIDT